MNASPSFALLPATPEAPTEICLSLYYDRPASSPTLASPIHDHLAATVAGWKLIEFTGEAPGVAAGRALYEANQCPAGFLSLYIQAFASSLSLHTEVVQLILSSAETYATAWPHAAAWLTDNLTAWLLPKQPAFLGYTLVYRANAGPDPTEPSLAPEVLAAVRSINGAVLQPVPPQILAQQPQDNQGWLLLLKYPQPHALELIYLVLGTGSQPDELASTVYFGPRATLPAQDVFVHKALRQSFLVSLDYDAYEARSLTPFKNRIIELLNIIDNPQLKTEQLDDLAQRLADLTHTHWDLSRLEHSLQQQMNGLKRLFPTAELPAIARRHLATLKSHWQEVHALVAQHHLVFTNARVAISLVEAQESKYATTLQQHFNLLLAIGGLLATMYQAIDGSVVEALLKLAGIAIEPASKSVFLVHWVPSIRLVMAAVLTGLLVAAYGLIKHSTKKKRAKRAAQRSAPLR